MNYLLQLYKKFLSPILGSILGFSNNTCRFYPTCSDYMGQAIKKYGYLKGTYKGITRILRCNQFFKGGIDYP